MTISLSAPGRPGRTFFFEWITNGRSLMKSNSFALCHSFIYSRGRENKLFDSLSNKLRLMSIFCPFCFSLLLSFYFFLLQVLNYNLLRWWKLLLEGFENFHFDPARTTRKRTPFTLVIAAKYQFVSSIESNLRALSLSFHLFLWLIWAFYELSTSVSCRVLLQQKFNLRIDFPLLFFFIFFHFTVTKKKGGKRRNEKFILKY